MANSLEESLDLFARIAEAQGEQYRALAYRRAIVALQTHDNATQMIGADIRAKIDEFRATGSIRELDALARRKSIRALLEFAQILGFGPATARSLIARHIYSREELARAVARRSIDLTRVQELGLRYHDDLQKSIARADVARIAEAIMIEIYRVADEPGARICANNGQRPMVEIAGSYRRRAASSRDIDILVACASSRSFLHALHSRLREKPEFIDVIVLGRQKYSFLWRPRTIENSHAIALDIILAHPREFWSSLLYFTGSRDFNIWLREQCKKRGMTLNQYGLRDEHGQFVPLESEEHIFRIIGLRYIEPALRNRAIAIT